MDFVTLLLTMPMTTHWDYADDFLHLTVLFQCSVVPDTH